MLSSVALYSQVTMIVMTSGSLFEGVADKTQAGICCAKRRLDCGFMHSQCWSVMIECKIGVDVS